MLVRGFRLRRQRLDDEGHNLGTALRFLQMEIDSARVAP
jgi:hypothetical protein